MLMLVCKKLEEVIYATATMVANAFFCKKVATATMLIAMVY